MKNYTKSKYRFQLIRVIACMMVIHFFGAIGAVGQIAQRGSATTAAITGTSMTINKPTGVVQNDVMIVNIEQGGNTTVNPTCTGWNLISGATIDAGGKARRQAILYKVAGVSEGTTYSFTLGSGVNEGSAAIVGFSGVDVAGGYLVSGAAGGPFDVIPSSISAPQVAGTTATASAITTSTSNAAVIMLASMMDGTANIAYSSWSIATSPSTTLTELSDYNGGAESIGAASALKPAIGNTGNGTVTLSASKKWGAILIALRPATATKLAYTIVPSTGTAGTPFSVTVQSQDANGNPASVTSATTITLSKATGAGSLSGTLTGTISSGGSSVTITTPVYSAADIMTLTASATAGMTGLTAVTSGNITFSAGAATKGVLTTQPSGAVNGVALSTQPVVQLQDASSNNVSTAGVNVVASIASGTGVLGETTTVATNASGIATFTNLVITGTAGNFTLAFKPTSLTVATSNSFALTAGALDHFAISSISSPQTAGTAIIGITLTAKDANNNTVTSFTGTVTYSGTAGITGTSAAFTAGQLTGVSVTPTNVGTGKTLIVTGSAKTGTATFDVVSGCTAGTWLGTTSADWNIGTNWCGGIVPTSSTAVVIPASGTNWPTLSTGQTGNCSSLTFSGAASSLNFTGGNLVVAGNVSFTAGIINSSTSASTLSVGGTWTGTGTTFTPSTFLTVDFTGATQTIPQLVSNYYNLTLSGSGTKTIGITTGTINGKFTLSGSVTANSGGAGGDVLTVAGDLSLTGSSILNMSNATQGITVNGNVSVGAGTQFNLQNGTANSIGGTFTVDGAFTRSVANGSGSLGISGTTTINNGGSFTVSTYCSLTFNGLLTINNGGSYSNSTTTGVILKGGITNGSSGTFTAGTGTYTFNTNSQEINGILTIPNVTVNANAILTITSNSALNVSGTLINSAGNSGLVLQSNATGTASLIHNSSNVPATVQRYITGAAEGWHFLSSPVSAQAISGTWLPSGTYGGAGGTGYDFYLWDEPLSCWKYKLNAKWDSLNGGSNNFNVARGYLYSVQATNPTKTFSGNLNNGTQSIALKYAGSDLNVKGFNLVGNPYPSSIDWQAAVGWTRTNLTTSGSGYDLWIYNPAASNYGVINSASETGTNSVTRYIAPMQGFFVLAASSGTLGMTNAIRVANGANDWKSASFDPEVVSITVASEQNSGSDEARLLFGYPQNQEGAPKLFSPATTAPSLYLAEGTKNYTLRYLSDTVVNREVAVYFKPGTTGKYTLTFDFESAIFKTVILEDRQAKIFQTLTGNPTYRFSATAADQPYRFLLHFAPIKEFQILELPAKISSDGIHILVDLTQVDQTAHVAVYDILGRKVYEHLLGSNSQHILDFTPGKTLLVVKLNNQQGQIVRKVWCNNSFP
jgi:hypothetical protein